MATPFLTLDTPPEKEYLPLDTPYTQRATPSEEQAEGRAIRASIGAGEISPGKDTIKDSILNGLEDETRTSLATQKSVRDYQRNMETAKLLAASSGGPVTPEEVSAYEQLFTPSVYDPSSFFEQQYGEKVVGSTASVNSGGSNVLREAFNENPEDTSKLMQLHSNVIATREYARTKLQDYEASLESSGYNETPQSIKDITSTPAIGDITALATYSPAVGDMLAQFIPLKDTVQWNVILGTLKDKLSFKFPGSAKDEIVNYLYSLPFDEFKQKFDETFTSLKNYDPITAREFASSIIQRSSTDSQMDNLWGALDVGSVAGPALLKGARVLKGVVKASSEATPKVENVLSETGQVVEGALIGASRLSRNPAREATNAKELEEILPSFAKPEGIVANIGSQKREAMNRIVQMAKSDTTLFKNTVANAADVERLTPEAVEAGVSTAYQRLQANYPKLMDSPYDITVVPIKDPMANTYEVEFKIGYTGGMPFRGPNNGEDAARAAADFYGLKNGEYEIKQDGLSSYISVTKPIRETDTAVRAALIETTNNVVKNNWLSRFIRSVNRADYNLSKFNQENRLLATYAPGKVRQIIYETGKPIRDLSRKERNTLTSVWEHNSSMENPVTGERGYFYQTVAEVEDGFRSLNLPAPTEKQISAYFAYTRMYDMDLYLRNLALTSAKSRLGVERVRFNIKARTSQGQFARNRTEYIDGRVETTFPDNPDDTSVLLFTKNDEFGKGTLLNLNDIRKGTGGELAVRAKKGVESGRYKLVQLHAPRGNPLKDVLGENQYVSYVITDTQETAPLTYKHLPNRPGGHIANEYAAYLKQPNWGRVSIGSSFRNEYLGDKTIVGFDSAAQALKFQKRFQQAILLKRAGNEDALKAYVNSNLPIPYEQFDGWFKPRFVDGKEIPPFLDPKEDLLVIPNGKNALDVAGHLKARPGFHDATQSAYDLSNHINVGFTGERSDVLYSIKETSSVRKDVSDGVKRALGLDPTEPAWQWEPSRVVDPIPILGRALGQAINSRWLNDYQNMAVESWIAQFGHFLDKATPNALKTNPFYFFHKGEFKSGIVGPDVDQLTMAKTSRQQIRQFLGYRSKLAREMDTMGQRLIDGIYNKLGPRSAEVAMHTLPFVTNADQLLRTVAFKSSLGMWNVPQFLVQMNTYIHTASVAGARAAFPAVPAAYFSSVLRYTRDAEVIAGIDAKLVNMTKHLTKGFKWKPGEFTESHALLNQTGFNIVGGEVATLDRMIDPTIVQSSIGRVIDSGDFFFREGERSARLASWHSAYREFRRKNPGVKVTDDIRAQILQRADDLNVNMSRASNSALNSGILSTATQFYSYSHAMASQIFGNKLTRAEKLRTLFFQSAIYGVPMGLSASGLPVHELIRKAAIDRGYGETINSDPLVSTLMNGFVQAGINWVTGVNPSVGAIFGNPGLAPIPEALSGEKEWWDILLGVSGTVVGSAISAGMPLAHWAMNMFNEDNAQFPWDYRDVLHATKFVSSFNRALRGAYAFNTGMWISKHDIPITRVDPWSAVAMSLFGVGPQDSQDMYLMSSSAKAQREAWQTTKTEMIDYIHKAFQAYDNDDPDRGDMYMARSQALFVRAGMSPEQKSQIFAEASRNGWMTMMERISSRFPKMGNSIEERERRREDQIKRMERLEKQKGEIPTTPSAPLFPTDRPQ